MQIMVLPVHKIMEKGDNSPGYIVLFSGTLKKFSANKILSLVYLNGVLQILYWYESTLWSCTNISC